MRRILFTLSGVLFGHLVNAQILTSDPPFPTPTDQITIYYNVASGNGDIPTNTVPVYAHTGVVSQQDEDNCVNNWQYVQGNWGTADPNVVMTPMGGGVHKLVITPQTYYQGLPGNFQIGRLMFVFRNQTGSVVGRNADGSDISFELYDNSFHAGIMQPYESVVIGNLNEVIPINCATSAPADLTLYVNGVVVASATNATSLNYNFSSAINGGFNIEFVATSGANTESENILINISPQPTVAAAPSGTVDGINYIDDQTVRLQLYAPNKDFVYVLGDFNNWQFNADYLMNRSPDGNSYWLELTGLQPGVPYRFQYSIDTEDMRVADVYSDMILDPWNDPWIPASTYPNLLDYPSCSTSQPVSVFTINEPEFNWTDQAYVRPPSNRLVIYELLVRDFLQDRTYASLIDTLDYLENLGVTAIELMPINEFEGNDSWGYNPSFFFAPDKAYGPKNKLKEFINECHARGIAVIQDIALNHSFGQNPMVRMYFNPSAGQYGQPTAESPWFNQTPKHDFNVGYDFNHESQQTRAFCKRVFGYWLEEYHMDGYRLDLSKGYTQVNTLGNTAAWGVEDQSRINILTDYYNHMQSVEPGCYVILEHFAENSEEITLSNTGMMLWGRMNTQYEQAAMGYSDNADLTWGLYTARGWSAPRLVTFAESHDEERMMVKTLQYGNSSGSYDIQTLNTSLDRMEMVHTFLIPLPGPKMIWQFGELGYDYSINYCSDGTINTNCRTYAKPVRWDYRDVTERYKLYLVTSALNQLKKTLPLFSTTDFNTDLAGLGKRIHLNSPTLNATIVGNFNVTGINMVPGFQHTGTWYDYFSGTSFDESNLNNAFYYNPGEYHIYFDQPMQAPDTTVGVMDLFEAGHMDFLLYPNPSNGEFQIAFSNPISGRVEVSLLDMTGRTIEVLANGQMGAGNQAIRVTSNIPSGAYFVRISNGTFQMTRPILLETE
ncbi:MAG: alpha-amylase family glycosyl hydrolase [Flavobacteriales bacterium]